MPSWLWEVGISLCLRHFGNLCPVQNVSLTTSSFQPHSKNYSHRGGVTKKNTRKATAMKMTQLYTLASAAQGLDVMIKKDIQS